MRRREHGFTIVELMIVVTIVGMLSAVAIPVYQGYVTRTMVAEALVVARPAQLAVAEHFARAGEWPADNAALQLGAPPALGGRYVRAVAVADGTVVATFGETTLLGHTLTLSPARAGGGVAWSCRTTLPAPLRPRGCA
jgi:type IV pilus assembly protein PilA